MGNPDPGEVAREVANIESTESKVVEHLWPEELQAERYGKILEQLWDALNQASNKLEVAASFPVGALVSPKLSTPQQLPHGIELFKSAEAGQLWGALDWSGFVQKAERNGWQLVQCEFRHLQFDANTGSKPAQSRYYFSAHLTNASLAQRAMIDGDLTVQWTNIVEANNSPAIARLDASHLTVKTRNGPPGFREVLAQPIAPPEGSYFIDPLILYDLDGDGLSEIILAASNLVLRPRPDGHFQARGLCRFPPGLVFTGLIADFDGDGVADFLCAKFEGLFLFKGSPGGTFDEPGRLVWAADPHLKYAQALTCGDVDRDGDLDVWLGQYKLPYDRGQMPTPYYDANDGYPSYLLLNDGHGNFTDATLSAGLGEKRWRRAYSASFVDLHGDGHPDLVVASDFAGLEIYTNDGHGRFSDATRRLLSERHGFGMSQLAADFNGDGRMDLLMIGMDVPIMDRLWHLGRPRPGFESYFSMGHAMVYGNRLFLGQESGQFTQTALNDSMARTGWSWGASALDFNNDGYPDLYMANGHESKQSVRDYETEFWMHDIYVGTSKDSLAAFAYFRGKQARTRGQGMSYGGYEKNRLFLNRGGKDFLDIGHLMGVALETDSRNVVADDLDGDGRMDLLVTTFEAWPEVRQVLHVYHNELADSGNWIGFRLREQRGGPSPVGARITLQYGGRSAVQEVVAGDSYRSQRATTLQFGLGDAQRVDTAEVRWPDGRAVVLREPHVNQYHAVTALEAVERRP